MRLIAIGKHKPGPERDLFDRYNARLRPALTVTDLPDGRGSPPEIKRREARSLLAALPPVGSAPAASVPGVFAIALDGGAPCPGSEGLARLLDHWAATARLLCFLIGGAEGLDATVLSRADHVLSLGPMTWPHMLVRPLLAEQLYRAQCILSGHPYHRAGRP